MAHPSPNKLSKAAAKALIAHHNKAGRVVAPGLTYGQLQHDTSAATGLKYGDASRALRGQVVQNEAQGARTADWYTQYQNAIAAAGQAQAAQNQAAIGGVQQLQQGLDSSAQKAWAGQQAAMAADAAQRGASTDPQLADQAHNASNVRNALTGSYGAMLASQGAAQQQGLSDRKVTAGQQGLEALRLNASKRADLASQRTAFEKEKGQFKTQFQQQEKSNASDTALKNALTAAQVGQYGANAAQSYASANASNASARKTRTETAFVQKYGYVPGKQPSALDQAKLDYFNKHGYFPKTGPASSKTGAASKPTAGPGSISSSLEQKRISQVRKLSQLIDSGVTDSSGKVIARPGDVAAVKKYFIQQGVDPVAILIAESLHDNRGKLGPGGVKQAHRYGIHVKGNFGTVPGVKKIKGSGGGLNGIAGGGG